MAVRRTIPIRADGKAEQVVDDVAGSVIGPRAEEVAEQGDLIAARNDGAFIDVIVAHLGMADVRKQAVAQALTAFGVFDEAPALTYVSIGSAAQRYPSRPLS